MKGKSKGKTISVVLTSVLIITTALCFIVIFQAAFSDRVSIFGHQFFYIESGSMEPTLPVGAVVAVHDTGGPYEVGDIITFISKDSDIYGLPNTHRIVDVTDVDGTTCYITKGDSNSVLDAEPVRVDDVIGQVVWSTGKVTLIGNIVAVLGTRFGFVLLILLPLILITAGCIKNFSLEYKKELRHAVEELNRAQSGENQTESKE